MKITRLISTYRWPFILGGLLAMSVIAQGVLVYVATRPDAPRPIKDYYERGLEWEADAAKLAASRRLGWSVSIDVPEGEAYTMAASRPVDLTVRDRDGAPVTGLTGRVLAKRPADTRLNGTSDLVELPHEPGRYRTLARLSATGVWELSLDAHQGEVAFLYTERVTVAGGETP